MLAWQACILECPRRHQVVSGIDKPKGCKFLMGKRSKELKRINLTHLRAPRKCCMASLCIGVPKEAPNSDWNRQSQRLQSPSGASSIVYKVCPKSWRTHRGHKKILVCQNSWRNHRGHQKRLIKVCQCFEGPKEATRRD